MTHEEEFFVGYLPTSTALKRRVGILVGLVAALIVAVALTLAVAQHGFARSVFEFGDYRTFEGVILERPYPMLLVKRPGEAGESQAFSTYLLVDPFKHGADKRIRGLHGKTVRLQAQLIHRDEGVMLELKPGSIQDQSAMGQPFDVKVKSLGLMTIKGELVDTKCFLGVMNPGSGKVHRDCAARCVSGGVPLGVVIHDDEHHDKVYLIASTRRGNRQVRLQRVGEVVNVTGDAIEINGQNFILIR